MPGPWREQFVRCRQFSFYNVRQRESDLDHYRSGIAPRGPCEFTGKTRLMRSITRRSFLVLARAIGGVSLLGWPGYPCRSLARAATAQPPAGELATIVAEYLQNYPRERDVHVLLESLGLDAVNAADAPAASERTVLLRIQQDFAEERTVSVAGWIFSRTELRVFALRSLSSR